MSAIVSGALKLTFGFLANKARSGIAERLKDSDVTDEQCRRLIVRELDDIKDKLNGLARKDLLSSLCFLQEGVNGLYQSLLQLHSNENTAESTGQTTSLEATSSTDTGPDSVINEAVALINAMTSLKIRSNDRFKSARKSFELARENATKAFCNEALSIEDRIQATQIRMMARILEKLEDPDASVSDCLQYLKQLHDIGAIQEIFSVLIDGGIKSRFNKTKRLDNASSVRLMNQILFEFARKFTKLPPTYLNWPMISFGRKSYHPVFGERALVEKPEKSGVQVMSLNPDFTFDEEIFSRLSVVNSNGNIVAVTRDKGWRLKIFKRSGESRTPCEVSREEHASVWYIRAMDIDAEDNIYLITVFRVNDEELWSFKLSIFDKNGNKKLEAPLPFRQNSRHKIRVRMAVNNDGKIVILDSEAKTLYIGKVCLEQNPFEVEKSFSSNKLRWDYSISVKVMFSDCNETKVIVIDSNGFDIYTENGEILREIDVAKEHGLIDSIAINHVMKRILVMTKHYSSDCYSLASFSVTGELIDSLHLGSSKWLEHARLTSHPNGPVALVGYTGATLLQL